MVLYGLVLSRMVLYEPKWTRMVLYGLNGHVWSRMVPYGPVWTCIALHSLTKPLATYVCLCSTHATSAQILCLLKTYWSIKILEWNPISNCHVRRHCRSRHCRQLTGNSVRGHYFCPYFPIVFFVDILFIQEVKGSKKTILQKLFGGPNNRGVHIFLTPSVILGPLGHHFGFYRRFYISHRRNAWIKKTYLAKVVLSTQ